LFNITSTQKNTAKSVPKTIQEYFLQTVTQHQHKVLLRLVFLKQNSFSNVLWAMHDATSVWSCGNSCKTE